MTEVKNKIIMNVSWRPTATGREAEEERDVEGEPKGRDTKGVAQSRGEGRGGKSAVLGTRACTQTKN